MHLFDPQKLANLDNPERLSEISLEKLVSVLNLQAGHHLADIGSGTGLFSFAFLPIVGAKGSVTGFDLQPECLAYAEKKLEENPDPRIRFILNTETHLPALSKSIDAVSMILVAHEISQPALFYSELERIMKEGTRLAIVDWRPESTPKGPPVEDRINPDSIIKYLQIQGYQIMSVQNLNTNYYLLVAQMGISSANPRPKIK